MRDVEDVSAHVVDAAFRIHTRLGPGLLERAYRVLLTHELQRRGLRVETQKPIALEFEGIRVPRAFYADLVIDELLVVELESIEKLAPVHFKQTLTYIRILGLHMGLLINSAARP